MTTPTPNFPQPTTAAEAAAAEQVVAAFYLQRVEAARAVMTGPEAQAFEARIAELLTDALPNGTSVAVNLPNVAKWFADVKTGADADFAKLDAIVNPPAAQFPVESPQEPATEV